MEEKVAIVGGDGRSHALGWKIEQSPDVSQVLYFPGNGGTGRSEKGKNIAIDATKKVNFDDFFSFVHNNDIDMVIVSPEGPLAAGIVNTAHEKGFERIIGPRQEAAMLESDKFYSYDLMDELRIPQAQAIKCYSMGQMREAIEERDSEEGVIKARGLKGGKGVFVYDTKQQALEELARNGQLYGEEVLIADRLHGPEFSVFYVVDGETALPFDLAATDHKRLFDRDRGPNTGGMGAFAPTSLASSGVIENITNTMTNPLIQMMNDGGTTYQGFLYAGMMMVNGKPYVIEWNARFGDPEAQTEMMMLEDDLYETLSFSLDGKLNRATMRFRQGAACCVVMAAEGYPGSYKKGTRITGLKEAELMENVKVFHAGTRRGRNHNIYTDGGRVLGVTAYSPNGLADAQNLAYVAASKIGPQKKAFFYRRDIGKKELSQKTWN